MGFANDPEWADITPIPQDDGPSPVVPIAYTPEFIEAHDYFRAILKKNELSARALKLTEAVIDLNAANYTAWHFRRSCLLDQKADLEKELKWVAELAAESPKNYQLWHHRRELVKLIGSPMDELAHVASILQGDAKNYHAWSHRQWLLKTFKVWDNELLYVKALLDEDIRNNSAWNQRWFVLTNTTGFTPDVIAEEVDFAMEAIAKAVNNESPWNYLVGLMRQREFGLGSKVEVFAQDCAAKDPECSQALSCLLELYAADPSKSAIAAEMCEKLCEVDPIRKNYWTFRKTQVEAS